VKLAGSTFPAKRAVLIYGFAYECMPLEPAIDAFEVLAKRRVGLGERHVAPLPALVHPVHSRGAVYAWEVAPTEQWERLTRASTLQVAPSPVP
jgi:hypothetical protein